MDIKFYNCEKDLTVEDINKAEKKLVIELPNELKKHYLKYNGGYPNKSLVEDPDEVFAYEIKDFIPMVYCDEFGNDPDFTLEGRTIYLWQNNRLPKYLLPFAMDWGGNYFCYDLNNEIINFYVMDTWSDNISIEKNHELNSKYLASSFPNFLQSLIDNPDDDRV